VFFQVRSQRHMVRQANQARAASAADAASASATRTPTSAAGPEGGDPAAG
jgi:hypothetical protein